jgi:hypothetical protein
MSTFDMPYFSPHASQTVKDEVNAVSVKEKKIRPRLPYEPRRDYAIIVTLSAILMAVFLVTTLTGPIMSSLYGYVEKSTECRSKILSYEQHGYYTSQEQFKSAIAYC